MDVVLKIQLNSNSNFKKLLDFNFGILKENLYSQSRQKQNVKYDSMILKHINKICYEQLEENHNYLITEEAFDDEIQYLFLIKTI